MAEEQVLRLFDAHCHLQDPRLPAEQLAGALQAAAAAGVVSLACNGCCPDDWPRVLEICEAHPQVAPNLGLHPWWAAGRPGDWLQALRAALLANPGAGLGECGLDKGPHAKCDLATQLPLFEAQLQLAQELRRPVSVHCVRAFGHVLGSLTKHSVTVPVVLHSWTGARDTVVSFLQRPNVYFSLSGYLTRLPTHKAIPMVQAIPLDRLLLESDCPDGTFSLQTGWQELLPELPELAEGMRAATGPSAVRTTLRLVAAATGRPEAELAAATYANAQRVFNPGP